jgi:ATP-dependent DNA ligase
MPKKPLPDFVVPMMASTVKKPFNDPDWIFETKLDGYRAIAVIDSIGKAEGHTKQRHAKLTAHLPAVNTVRNRSELICENLRKSRATLHDVPYRLNGSPLRFDAS